MVPCFFQDNQYEQYGKMKSTVTEEINEINIPQLFIDICMGKKTGTVVFELKGALKKVFFNQGNIIYASSTLDEERLGECLLRDGKITEDQYERATEALTETGRKFGVILVKLGYIAPRDLVEGARSQVKRIILSLFSWQGAYRFEEGPLRPEETIPLHMSVEGFKNVIIEGLGRIEEQTVRTFFPRGAVLRKAQASARMLFQVADLPVEQKKIHSLINGARTLEDIRSLAGAADYDILKTAYTLLVLRMVEIRAIPAPAESAAATKESPVPSRGEAADDAGAADRRQIQQAYEQMGKQDYYQMLGLGRHFTGEELRKAYRNLVKAYHPDRHYGSTLTDLKEKLETIFNNVCEAYKTLGNEADRSRYDRDLREGTEKTRQDKPVDKKAVAAEQFEFGMKAYAERDFRSAEASFEWACTYDPNNATYFYYKGLAQKNIPQRGRDAEESFKTALNLNPILGYHLELGNFYLQYGRKTLALSQFREALKKDPTSESARTGFSAADRMVEGKEPGSAAS
jgi:curved DNA-binding protein CbpA